MCGKLASERVHDLQLGNSASKSYGRDDMTAPDTPKIPITFSPKKKILTKLASCIQHYFYNRPICMKGIAQVKNINAYIAAAKKNRVIISVRRTAMQHLHPVAQRQKKNPREILISAYISHPALCEQKKILATCLTNESAPREESSPKYRKRKKKEGRKRENDIHRRGNENFRLSPIQISRNVSNFQIIIQRLSLTPPPSLSLSPAPGSGFSRRQLHTAAAASFTGAQIRDIYGPVNQIPSLPRARAPRR